MPFCRQCGTEVADTASFCHKCGAVLSSPSEPQASHSIVVSYWSHPRKNPGTTELLAGLGGIFLFGLGHFYVGKVRRGFILLILSLVLTLPPIFFWWYVTGFGPAYYLAAYLFSRLPLGPGEYPLGEYILLSIALLMVVRVVLWIWQTSDAYSLANKYNAEVERTGKPPW